MDEFHDNRATTASTIADSDCLILVDEADHGVGHLSKVLCHEGRGVLHRAFSLLIFNGSGELMLQKRSAFKRLWPLYWSNSCCSHPRGDETMEAAIHRRLYEELGLRCPLHFLFKFQYQAQFDETGAENELCSVFIGRSTDPVKINGDEISFTAERPFGTFTYSGKVSGNEIKFKVTFNDQNFEMTAKRVGN